MIITDILSFAISDFSDTFIESTNQNDIIFKSEYIYWNLWL